MKFDPNRGHVKSRYDQANILSKMLFSWMLKFFIDSQKKKLKVSDLELCPNRSKSSKIGSKLEREWEKQLSKLKQGKKPSLIWAIIKSIGPRYSIALILLFFQISIPICQTLCMGNLVDLLYLMNKPDADKRQIKVEIYLYALGVVISQIIVSYTSNFYWFNARIGGMNTRVACSRLIYRKTLRLSQKALGETATGKIVNLLSNDVARFDFASEFPFFFVLGPLQSLVCLYILWPYFGVSIIIGFVFLLAFAPFQYFMGKAFGKLREKGAFLTDERIRLMNEFIPAMRVIKMYAWEKPFASLVHFARKREVSKIRKAAYLKCLNLGIGTVSEKLIMFLVLCSYVLMGNHLSAKTVFVAMTLIRQLQYTVTIFMPLGIAFGAEALISIRRIQKFLQLPELESRPNTNSLQKVQEDKEPSIKYENVQIRWKEGQEPVLSSLDFNVNRGQLMTIVGPVGSGKSTLLASILGEVVADAGLIEMTGKISYACQQAWIFAGTVRENILFGNDYVSARYREVIHVVALERDLILLPDGDQTIVGDRGASLSGGQKARINLARALYAKADIYLLDDPLSAVDAPVAKHIFEKSVKKFLGDKLCILVTHQLQFIKSADLILLLRDGGQVCLGDYTEFLKKGNDFLTSTVTTENEPQLPVKRKLSRNTSQVISRKTSVSSVRTSITANEPEIYDDSPVDEADELAGLGRNSNSFWTYIRSGINPFILPIFTIYLVGAQLLVSFIEYYFSLWTDSEERKSDLLMSSSNETIFQPQSFVDNFSQTDNILFFAGLTLIVFIWCLTRNVAFFYVCMSSSIKLHARLFKAVVRAPIAFFDTNPPGLILNRISRDMGTVDDFLPSTLFDTCNILTSNFAAIVLMAIINGYLALPGILLFVVVNIVRYYYVDIALDVKRLEGVTKSPVFSHLSTSVAGLTTIRAFKVENRFGDLFDHYQDDHSAAYFTWISSSRFFISSIFTFSNIYTVTIIGVLLLVIDSLNGSKVGLIITSTIGLANGLQWGMRQLTEVETMMTSVERIDQMRHIKPEAELEATPENKPIDSWPDQGNIKFHHVYLKYDQLKPPVLNDINITFEGKEKIGIVGRTGAGKSSIMTALYRMTEFEGQIIIDGIDVKNIGLHDLRKKISIIPQEPVIFSGTIRYNLDPFGTKIDADLFEALDQVQLKRTINEMGGLDALITDGGTNLSVGQRQLVCLARAILANNKILVLDEATANIDPATDELIQQTIRKRFSDCTVLTIAHRLHTIMDSDKILVMDSGKVVQFDDPASLLDNKDGILYSMVQATGKETADSLLKIAVTTLARSKDLKDQVL